LDPQQILDFFTELRDTHLSGVGVKETSYYPYLANLLTATGKSAASFTRTASAPDFRTALSSPRTKRHLLPTLLHRSHLRLAQAFRQGNHDDSAFGVSSQRLHGSHNGH
jgi:hypothetical protein